MTAAELLDALAQRGVLLRSVNGDLKVRAPSGVLGEADVAELRQRKPELIAELRDRGNWGRHLSAQQERLWYLEQLESNLTAYVLPGAFRLDGPLKVDVLQDALREFIARHDIDRVHIVTEDGRPRIAHATNVDLAFRIVHARDILEVPTDLDALARWIEVETDVALHLDAPPLIRFTLVRVSDDLHVLILLVHHAIWDGWGFDIFLREVGELYASRIEGRPSTLAPLEATYADFVQLQRRRSSGPRAEEGMTFWSEVLQGTLPDLELVGDRPRPAVMTYEGGRSKFTLSADELAALRAFAQAERTTVFVILLAVWKVLLHRITRQSDLIVAVPVQGRLVPEFEQLIGFFVNTVVVRTHPGPARSFRDYLREVGSAFAAALDHQDTPFEWLVRRFGRRDPSRTPIFQSMFTHQFTAKRNEAWGDVRIRSFFRGARSVTTDVAFWVREYEERMDGGLDFRTDLYDQGSADALVSAFHHILRGALANPDTALADIDWLDDAARVTETRGRAGELRDAEAVASFVAQIDEQGRERPSAIAVVDDTGAMLFAELVDNSKAIAAALHSRGVGRGDAVAVLADRGKLLPSVMMGIMRLGAVYLPFDPTYPEDRLRYMAEDSGARVALVSESSHELAHDIGLQPLLVSDALEADGSTVNAGTLPGGDEPAYRIYTSGSTGLPKAVEVSHGALNNFLTGTRELLGFGAADVLLAVTTISFDISLLELLLPLCAGGRVVVASSDDAVDADALMALMRLHGITAMQATPATWRLLLDAGWRGGLSLALCGGEAFPRLLADELLSRCDRVWNMYGPTETTVWSTAQRVEPSTGRVPVGRPILNTRVYVLDSQRRPVPQGVPGEIWIGGDGVARGYWRRPELTAERFIADPFSSDPLGRLYRTGDLGRWRADGTLDHLGRVDFQVKVRGYRIELGEIESVLESIPGIRQAAVDTRGNDADMRLVGWFVTDSTTVDPPTSSELRRALRDRLPPFMVPSLLVQIDEMPLTLNGKVDRRQLPDPMHTSLMERLAFEAPQGQMEEAIAQEWQRLLAVERIGRHDNFFELGGHSLLSLQAVAAIEARTGRRLDPRRFFFSSLAQLAEI